MYRELEDLNFIVKRIGMMAGKPARVTNMETVLEEMKLPDVVKKWRETVLEIIRSNYLDTYSIIMHLEDLERRLPNWRTEAETRYREQERSNQFVNSNGHGGFLPPHMSMGIELSYKKEFELLDKLCSRLGLATAAT